MSVPAKPGLKVGRVIPTAPWPSRIATSLDPEAFGYAPFSVAPKLSEGGAQRGGLGKAHQLFGEQLPKLLIELNVVLAA